MLSSKTWRFSARFTNIARIIKSAVNEGTLCFFFCKCLHFAVRLKHRQRHWQLVDLLNCLIRPGVSVRNRAQYSVTLQQGVQRLLQGLNIQFAVDF